MDANQTRRRADLASCPVRGTCGGATSQLYVETFKYSALQQDKDCMRLVHIESAAKDDDPISCTLTDVTFGERPKYQALSYMWGDETGKLKILLNGAEFSVTRNLFDALQFLRRGPVGLDRCNIHQSIRRA